MNKEYWDYPNPICFTCKHFKQYAPLDFVNPGDCMWYGNVPAWLDHAVNATYKDDYYLPKRSVLTFPKGAIITECQTYEAKLEQKTPTEES